MRNLSVGPLRWAVGVFLVALGAQMLVTPHRFGAPVYAGLLPYLSAWAAVALVAGAGLIATGPFALPRRAVVAAHAVAAAVLCLLAVGFLGSVPAGAANYVALAIATLLALLPERPAAAGRRRGDLLALLVGLAMLIAGARLIAAPAQFDDPAFAAARPWLPPLGVAFVAAGAALVYAQLRPAMPAGRFRAAHLAAGGLIAGWGTVVALASGATPAALSLVAFGVVTALLPELSRLVRRADAGSLRIRLAFALVATGALPLVLLVAVVADRLEAAAVAASLGTRRNLTAALAENVGDQARLYRAAVVTLAGQPDLLSTSPEAQRRLLQVAAAYPEVAACQIADATGTILARSDDRPTLMPTGSPVFEEVRRTGAAAVLALVSPYLGRPVVAFGAPIRDPGGAFAGVVACSVETARLADQLARAQTDPGDLIYLVDERGRALAHPDTTVLGTDLSAQPPVAASLGTGGPGGSLRWGAGDAERLAAFSPVPDRGWVVVAERPVSTALANVRAARVTAFGLLVVVVAASALVGALVADRLAAPLRRLAAAAAALSADGTALPLPASRIGEVQAIGDAMGALSGRLATRTRERDEAEARLRFLADASQTLVSSLDLDATLAALARLVLPRLGRVCVIDVVEAGGAFRRVAAAGDNPDRDDVARQLRRYPPRPDGPHGAAKVVRSGETFHDARLTDAIHGETARDAQHLDLIRRLGLCATVSTPLRSRGDLLGVITVWRGENEPAYTADEIGLIEELARRAGAAVDNARLFEGERLARGEAEGAVAQVRSVNERLVRVSVRAQELAMAAAAERDRLRQILDVLPEAVVLVDAGGRTLIANEAAAALFGDGVTAGAAGEPPAGLPPAVRLADGAACPADATPVRRALDRGEVVRGEQLLVRQAGTGPDVPILASAAPLRDGSNRIVGAVLACQDITPLRDLDAARQAFLATVSHDLKNPITTIRGLAQAGQRRLAREERPDPAAQMRQLDAIVGATTRLTALVEELGDVTALQMGRPLALRRAPTDLVALARRAAEEAAERVDHHRIRFHSTEETLVGDWDEARLERVIGNLLDNAIKYSPDGGAIDVSLAVEAGVDADGSAALLTVRDQGLGVPAADLPTVFERFRRGRNVVGRIAGTGIGLAGVRQIVEQHGGAVTVESREGEGSAFTVCLPRRPAPLGDAARESGAGEVSRC